MRNLKLELGATIKPECLHILKQTLSAEVENLGGLRGRRAVMLRRPAESDGQRQHGGKLNPGSFSNCGFASRLKRREARKGFA
jgi:hypothetical protein